MNKERKEKFFPYVTKVVKAIGDYINDNGGIFGYPIKIILSTGWEDGDTDKFAEECMNDNNLIAAIPSGKVKLFNDLVKDSPFLTMVSAAQDKKYLQNPNAFNLTRYDQYLKFKVITQLVADTKKNSKICFFRKETESLEDLTLLYDMIGKVCETSGRELKKIQLSDNEQDSLSYFSRQIEEEEGDILWVLACTRKNIEIIDVLHELYDDPKIIAVNGNFFEQTKKYPKNVILCNSSLLDLGELGFDNFIQRIVPDADPDIRSNLIFTSVRYDQLKILHYASKIGKQTVSDSREDLCKALFKNMTLINGQDYCYEGLDRVVYFNEKRKNVLTDVFVKEFISEEKRSILAPYQYKYDLENDIVIKSSTVYVYIDMLRVASIDDSDSVFSAEFYLDINSNSDISIDDIQFDNISIGADDLKTKELLKTVQDDNGSKIYRKRYSVSATFKFDVDLENYPLDKQLISIDLAPVYSEGKSFQFQPMPRSMQDLEFECSGWDIISGRIGKNSGVWKLPLNRKFNMSFVEKYNISFGWIVKRQINDTLLKICVPLGILIMISYFPVVSSKESSDSMMGVLITSLLAAIALYFSIDKPVSDKMTLMDKVFVLSYVVIGLYLVGLILTIPLSAFYYDLLMKIWMLACPALLLIVGLKMYRIFKRKSLELI